MHTLPRLLACLLCLFYVGARPGQPSYAAPSSTRFDFEKGVNLSHWLSQTKDYGDTREKKVTEADFRQMAKLGFDHVRFPVDEEHLWQADGSRDEAGWRLLHVGIGWSLKHNVKVIVDLHVLRSHHFNQTKGRTLWTDPKEQDKMVNMWTQLSRELRKYPLTKVAYEVMNEPAANNPEDWNKLMNRAIVEIRRTEPKRVILVGSRYGNQVKTFSELAIPRGDPNLVLSFHYYAPLLVTHYKAPWSRSGKYSGPITYPGQTVDPKEYEKITDPSTLASVKDRNGIFGRESIEQEILTMVKLGKELGLRVHCGEFGCYSETPVAMRQQWYRDIMSVFRKHDIAWSHWDWKGGFAIVNKNLSPKTEYYDILMDREPAGKIPPATPTTYVPPADAPLINPSE